MLCTTNKTRALPAIIQIPVRTGAFLATKPMAAGNTMLPMKPHAISKDMVPKISGK
jgi:hypothetical protein